MLLKVNKLSVSTNSSKPFTILKDVNFTLPENSIFTITGRNGSGKTTLIKSLTSLTDAKQYIISGEVFFNDQLLSGLNSDQLLELRKHRIKYIFQDSINSFDPLRRTGYYFDNIPGDKAETDQLLEYFYLPVREKLFNLYPYELSGGMAQRTAIVLALRAKPELLIFDEPTSGLDSPAVNLLIHKLKEFSRTKKNSVLIVTQDLEFANEISSCISLLNNGVLTGPLSVQEFNQKNLSGVLHE